jgi:hypothetical protein
MPLIREEVFGFVRLWNAHKIRKQRNRPFLPVGQPIWLYNHPTADNPDFALPADPRTIELMQEKLEAFGRCLLLLVSHVYN